MKISMILGCLAAAVLNGGGCGWEDCETDADCAYDERCDFGSCETAQSGGSECSSGSDCGNMQVCRNGYCEDCTHTRAGADGVPVTGLLSVLAVGALIFVPRRLRAARKLAIRRSPSVPGSG